MQTQAGCAQPSDLIVDTPQLTGNRPGVDVGERLVALHATRYRALPLERWQGTGSGQMAELAASTAAPMPRPARSGAGYTVTQAGSRTPGLQGMPAIEAPTVVNGFLLPASSGSGMVRPATLAEAKPCNGRVAPTALQFIYRVT